MFLRVFYTLHGKILNKEDPGRVGEDSTESLSSKIICLFIVSVPILCGHLYVLSS